MPMFLKDSGWVRYIATLVCGLAGFIWVVSKKDSTVEQLQKNDLLLIEQVKELRADQKKDHENVMRQGIIQEQISEDVREMKTLLRNKN